MKKLIYLMLVLPLIYPAVAFPQGSSESNEETKDKIIMMHKGMMGHAGKAKMYEKCTKMSMAMKRSMVPTSDGGVIILAGNKLFKYDKDLNLVKETEIKIDIESMKKMMKEKCPRTKEMMQDKKQEGEDKTPEEIDGELSE